MTMDMAVKEGFVSFRGYQVWYRVVGDDEAPGKLPLLCLHGGPGAPHDYLEPLEAMVATGRRVIFYDQLGAGNSDHPHNPSLWTVPLVVEELGVVRQALGLERVHLLGQSWGGNAWHGICVDPTSGLGEFDCCRFARKYAPMGRGSEPSARGTPIRRPSDPARA